MLSDNKYSGFIDEACLKCDNFINKYCTFTNLYISYIYILYVLIYKIFTRYKNIEKEIMRIKIYFKCMSFLQM